MLGSAGNGTVLDYFNSSSMCEGRLVKLNTKFDPSQILVVLINLPSNFLTHVRVSINIFQRPKLNNGLNCYCVQCFIELKFNSRELFDTVFAPGITDNTLGSRHIIFVLLAGSSKVRNIPFCKFVFGLVELLVNQYPVLFH